MNVLAISNEVVSPSPTFDHAPVAPGPPRTPATDLARSLVVFEAMVGQVFLATVIARVVSMLGADRPARVRR